MTLRWKLVVAATIVACAPPDGPAPPSRPPVAEAAAPILVAPDASAAPPDPPPPRELADAGRTIDLDVPGFSPSVVVVPHGPGPHRVLIAAHGNYDRPEWQCAAWRLTVGDRALVLCPRGTSRPDSPSSSDVRYTYASAAALGREVDAGLGAVSARFGADVDVERVVWTGFSLGAIFGVHAMAKHPERFASGVLVEGGAEQWDAQSVKRFAAGGGKAVLFACAQAGCFASGKQAAARLGKAGVKAAVTGKKIGVHAYGGEIGVAIAAALDGILLWADYQNGRGLARAAGLPLARFVLSAP